MICRRIDFAGKDSWISFVFIAPLRHARLAMTWEARLRLPDKLPFSPARAIQLFVARIDMIIREIVRADVIRDRHDDCLLSQPFTEPATES